jgi:nucleoside-diphosphate-sugar epimerase
MKVLIVGGRGRIALLLTEILSGQGHAVVGTVRSEPQGNDVVAAGGTPLVFDVAIGTSAELAGSLAGVDAVVFAAGAGYGSSTRQKEVVDRDGAVLLADAAQQAGVKRYVLISSMGVDYFDKGSSDPFQIYLRLKGDADTNIRARPLDWTIVRPSGLGDGLGTGHVRLGESIGGGSIPRADVAALIARVLVENIAIHRQFEVTSGPEPIDSVVI